MTVAEEASGSLDRRVGSGESAHSQYEKATDLSAHTSLPGCLAFFSKNIFLFLKLFLKSLVFILFFSFCLNTVATKMFIIGFKSYNVHHPSPKYISCHKWAHFHSLLSFCLPLKQAFYFSLSLSLFLFTTLPKPFLFLNTIVCTIATKELLCLTRYLCALPSSYPA